MTPFTGPGLAEIKVRSHGRSELSGRTDRPLHCTHLDHTRDEDYNGAERGVRTTIVEHLAYHLYFRETPRLIGLNKCRNDYAIARLNEGCVAFLYSIGKLDELEHELEESTGMWEELFART